MATRELPSRPNLAQYRKQAKELFRACKAGDPEALRRFREHHPPLRKEVSLADAQFVIAREHGFESWPRFAKSIQPADFWKLAEDAVVAGDVATLERLLRDHEDLRRRAAQSSWSGGLAPDYAAPDARSIIARNHQFESWEQYAAFAEVVKDRRSPAGRFEAAVDAIVAGDVATLQRLLRADPELIHARSLRKHRSTLFHYVGANGVEGFRQRTPKNAAHVAEVLLDAGAEIDAVAGMYGGSTTLELVATSIHPVLAGVQNALMEFLLERGASLRAGKTGDARSDLINACLANGRLQAAEFLARRAEGLDLEAAAGVGRLDLVKRRFDDATEAKRTDAFSWACEYGRTEIVVFLLDHGMPVDAALKNHGQTGLHWAAYGAHLGVVNALLERNAPLEVRDPTFGGTPLGWALYSWGERTEDPERVGEHYEVIARLRRAGAAVDWEWLAESRRGMPLVEMLRADPRMIAALQGDDS